MTAKALKELLPMLQGKRFHTESIEGLIAYARIYAALYNLVSVNALDEEYGDRSIYRKKLQSLFSYLHRRYEEQSNAALRAETIGAMLYILNDTGCIYDRQKNDLCFNLFSELAEGYLSDFDENSYDPNALYGVMRLIYEFLCWLVPEDAKDDPWLGFARRRIATWASELDPDGGWLNIGDEEVLQRIILMSMNSYMQLDSRYDDAIHRAYSYYCVSRQLQFRRAKELSADEIRYYARMYDTIQQSTVEDPGRQTYLNDIAKMLETQIPHFPAKSSEAQLCHSIAIDNRCNRIANKVQAQMWASVK